MDCSRLLIVPRAVGQSPRSPPNGSFQAGGFAEIHLLQKKHTTNVVRVLVLPQALFTSRIKLAQTLPSLHFGKIPSLSNHF
jgi:hypothetical protein